MNSDDEKASVAYFARVMVSACVRNTQLEDIHAGRSPMTKTGDFSDVKIIDAEGNEFTWNEVSHIPDEQMKSLMQEVVNRTYTFLLKFEDPDFAEVLGFYDLISAKWDKPKIYPKRDW